MSDQKLKIAVFIDFDNVEIGVKTTLGLQFDIGAVLEAIKERGEIVTKVAYGDWKRSGDYARAMSNHAVRLVQRVMTPGGDKNGADINLALDALEMAFTHAHINAFVIVGGDSDFITLVEKLKQYDRKVFVVGGRAFTSQVMQKNCTEFIAYENVVPDRRPHARPERGGDRPRSAGGQQPIDQAVPLVKRALKLLADREVTPQLGLLKSTLLQLDSSFSERDYGVGSFRDFADKLAQQGLVTLKHQGRSTLVELVDMDAPPRVISAADEAGDEGADMSALHVDPMPRSEIVPRADRDSEPGREVGAGHDGGAPGRGGRDVAAGADGQDGSAGQQSRRDPPADPASLGEGVALVRRMLAEATTAPRWPMYPRQFKQFLRNAQPDFDERKYGSIAELMRACQKDGILKLERDRQGGLRVFAAGSSSTRPSVPRGWSILAGGAVPGSAEVGAPAEDTGEGPDFAPLPAMVDQAPAVVDAEVVSVDDDNYGNRISDPPPASEKPRRARKTAAKKPVTARRAPRKAKAKA